MADLILSGATSGSVTLAAPAVSGSTVLTLPTASGTVLSSVSDLTAQVKTATNATGSAPVFAARAWVNFNGTGTVAIRASGNVSSITDNGVGDYTVNFTTAMDDVNYATTTNAGDLANSGRMSTPRAIATGSVRVVTTDTPGLTTDYTYVAVAVHR